MYFIEITEFLDYIGVNDRETPRFENIWPLPKGVSYNSYLLKGEKTALLDTVKITKVSDFIGKLRKALGGRKLDYLVVHHMEPDHAGSIKTLLDLYPDIQLVGNKKTVQFLDEFMDIKDNIIEVDEGGSLDLGGRKLTFYKTPMVHWPESMVSYEEYSQTLFSQDIFGGFGALDGNIFDDEQGDFASLESEIRRYYSNIVGKHSKPAAMALKKLENLEIQMICPVHGPIWRESPKKIIDLYAKYANHQTEPGVMIVYGSMYGTNAEIADILARQLAENGVKNVKVFDISKTNISYVLSDIWKYNGLILGSCTYDNRAFPKISDLINIIEMNKIENHYLGIYGTYSWSGGGVKEIREFGENSKFEVVSEVEIKSRVNEEDYQDLAKLAKDMAEKVLS